MNKYAVQVEVKVMMTIETAAINTEEANTAALDAVDLFMGHIVCDEYEATITDTDRLITIN